MVLLQDKHSMGIRTHLKGGSDMPKTVKLEGSIKDRNKPLSRAEIEKLRKKAKGQKGKK